MILLYILYIVLSILFLGSVVYIWWLLFEMLLKAKCEHIWKVQFFETGSFWRCAKCGKTKFYENKNGGIKR